MTATAKSEFTLKSGIRDNRSRGSAAEFLTNSISPDSSLSVVSAYFTSFAHAALASELEGVEKFRFLFGEPRFLGSIDTESLDAATFELEDDGLSLKDGLRKRAVALACADWIERKVDVRSIRQAGLLHGKLFHVDDGRREHAMVGSSNFTLRGLGLAAAPNIELNLVVDGDRDRADLLAWFNEIWTDETLTTDVKEEVLRQLERVYRHNSPEFIYFKTLFHLFEQDLADKKLEDERLSASRFTDSIIWNMLYQFQKDGLRAVLSKLDNHGGCILADSVGLGKTFVALAVIKWYELRNQRVLVLCPKKLRENWTEFLAQNASDTNPLVNDKLGYTVLSHTDLSRDRGMVGDIDLGKVNWGNFDLVVIDESHNFRNAARGRSGRQSRYERLMDRVVKDGLKTRVLMLSATPVNNDLSDLKSQLDLIVSGDPRGFGSIGIGNLPAVIGVARTKFKDWIRAGARDKEALIASLPAGLFTLLDNVTIARSRGHIERHYASAVQEVGRFPRRERPVSVFSQIDKADEFPPFEHVHDRMSELQLALYNPIRFVRPEYIQLYARSDNFDQANRERFLIAMMKTSFLKRLESSVNSFGQTMNRVCSRIEARLGDIEAFGAQESNRSAEALGDEIEGDEDLAEAFEVGGALKFNLAHMDTEAWREALAADRQRLKDLSCAAADVSADRDAKLHELIRVLRENSAEPAVNSNGEFIRKAIVFTAFADTARYLYDHLLPLAQDLGIHIALVTGGSDCKTTFGRARYQDILVNFAPRAKNRAAMAHAENGAEVDLLIATDCISEGQNLQDANLVINYDIHWNPVRLIQRFGRIDRLGSLHERIRMVNFWPVPDLNRYIRLQDRVEARMWLVDLTATGDDNLLADTKSVEEAEVRWREKQLLRLRDEVFDLEEAQEGITLNEFTLEDFRADLFDHVRATSQQLGNAPLGLHALLTGVEAFGRRLT